MKDGKQVAMTDLRKGDRLTATIITERPPTVTTERSAVGHVSAPPKAEKPAEAAPAAAPAPEPAAAPAPEHKKLPKTGSDLPLVGVLGLAFLASALGLRTIRRFKTV